jgi:hypothetical protein
MLRSNVDENSSISNLFEDKFVLDNFLARCNDLSESVSFENAKVFKEEFLKRNVNSNNSILNLNSMKMGFNSITAIGTGVEGRNFERINLADN